MGQHPKQARERPASRPTKLALKVKCTRIEREGCGQVTAYDKISSTLVEAVEIGWWYSARVPDGRLVTMLMTDRDLLDRRLPSDEEWQQLLVSAPYTAARVKHHGCQPSHPPRLIAAESGRLSQFWGDGWVAVGDAAMSYDPLAAHGLTLALAGGRDAALAVTAHLAGQPDALAAYAWRLESAYTHYASRRQIYYRAEQRSPTASYWKRRTGDGR